jgi:hypothetical protein
LVRSRWVDSRQVGGLKKSGRAAGWALRWLSRLGR